MNRRRNRQVAWSPGAAGPVIAAAGAGWEDAARCAGPGRRVDFFPADTDVDGIAAAKTECAACPVRAPCLHAQMDYEAGQGLPLRAGIWGGLTPGERWEADRTGRLGQPKQAPRPRTSPEQPRRPARPIPDLTAAETARFWAKTTAGGCGITWTGGTFSHGHGQFNVRRDGVQQHVLAHRLAFKLVTGQDPAGNRVLQACGNPLCVTRECLTSVPATGPARARAA